jgi:hypothetical protein
MCDVTYILQAIKSELKGIQPLKDRVRKDLMQALVQSSSKSLCGCRLEVVGSSSWGGDVPHSDLDMVLVTPSGTASGSDAIAALRDLRTSVEELFWWTPCDGWPEFPFCGYIATEAFIAMSQWISITRWRTAIC